MMTDNTRTKRRLLVSYNELYKLLKTSHSILIQSLMLKVKLAKTVFINTKKTMQHLLINESYYSCTC